MFWKMHYGTALLMSHGVQAATTAATIFALAILGMVLGSMMVTADADHPSLQSVDEIRRVA